MLCVSVLICMAGCEYIYVSGVHVLHGHAFVGNTNSALFLVGPGGVKISQPLP